MLAGSGVAMIPTLLLVLASPVPGQIAQTPSATESEVRAMEARRRLARGEVRLTQLPFGGGGSKPDQKRISHIWFDGKQIRNDVIHYPKGQDPFRDINCKNCQFDGTFVTYSTALGISKAHLRTSHSSAI